MMALFVVAMLRILLRLGGEVLRVVAADTSAS